MNHYSSLQTERQYLLTALANEETRAETLIQKLEQTRAKLRELDPDAPREAIQTLKKAAASLVRRLKRCQRSEKAMVNNLAALTIALQTANNEKWRRAEFQNRQMVQAQQYGFTMDGLGQGMQGMNLVSPLTPVTQQGWATPTSPDTWVPSPVSTTSAFVFQDAFGSPLYTPFYETFPSSFMYGQANSQQHQQRRTSFPWLPFQPQPQEQYYSPQQADQVIWPDYSMVGQATQQPTVGDELGPLHTIPERRTPRLKIRTMSLPTVAGKRSSIWTLNSADQRGGHARSSN